MIQVQTWIRHDGKVYEEGEILSASILEEKRLVTLGVAEYTQNSKVKEDAETGTAAEVQTEKGNLPEIPEDEEKEVEEESRQELEEAYRALGGQPREDWTLEKLQEKLEERRNGKSK